MDIRSVHVVNLGCARNLVDGEHMMGLLGRAGIMMTDHPEKADAIVINTCSFIEAATEESVDTILEMAEQKKTGRCRRLIVVGCLPERYREDIRSSMPEVDVFLGTGAYDRILDAVRGDNHPAGEKAFPDPDQAGAPSTKTGRLITTGHMAYVKIAEGCDRHCTYCIIPKLRGRQRSRLSHDVVSEARGLIAQGVRELVLVAQETTHYGSDLTSGENLAGLLDALAALSPDVWIRTLYGHPESLNERIVQIIDSHANLCSYFDIPIQHGSDSVLKRMGRRYGRDDLLRMVDRIRSRLPEAALRTTVIVGFPGETDRDFETLTNLVKTVRFHHLGVFTYSDAADLPSHGLPDPVPRAIAEDRRDRLMALQRDISESINETYLDRRLTVLLDEVSEPGLYMGRTEFQAPEVDGVTYVKTAATDPELKPGTFVKAVITDTLEYDLIGETQ